MIEAKAPQPVRSLLREPPALHSSLPASFMEYQQSQRSGRVVEGSKIAIPASSFHIDRPSTPTLFAKSLPNPDASPLGSLLTFWPEIAAASSTIVSPRGKKLRNALLIETIGRSAGSVIACAPQTVSPTEIAVATPQLRPTEIISPSSTNTPEATPTAVVDFIAGAKPEGEGVALDSTRHQWMRTVNGEKQYYSQEIQDWTVSHVTGGYLLKGGVPLINKDQGGFPSSMLPFYIDYPVGQSGPEFQHNGAPTDPDAPTFSNVFYSRLLERYFGKNLFKISSADAKSFFFDFSDGKISIPFTTPAGEFVFKINKNTVIREVVIPWDKADPAKDPRFVEWSLVGDSYKVKSDGKGDYRSMILGNENGDVIIVTASKKPMETMTDVETSNMLFVPLTRIAFYNDDVSIMGFVDFVYRSHGAAPSLLKITAPEVVPAAVPKEGDTKIVVENGKDVTYTYKIITSADNKETLYSGWFKLVTPTALPTYDWDTYVPDGNGGYKFGKDILPKQVFIEEGVSGAEVIRSLTHVQTPDGTVNNENYMATLSPQIFKRYFGYFPTAKDNPTWQKLQQELQDGNPDTAQLTFTVDGKEYHWSPGPNVGTVVYIIKWDNAAPVEGNGFKEWEEPGLNHFRSTFWGVDAKGNIIGAIASKKPLNELTDIQIREMVLFHDISALYFKDLTNIGYSMPLYDFATTSGAESPPQIQINKNQ